MAWSLQKLFAVEEEFEDEDFLSAVKDVETTFSDSGSSVNWCLRPIASSLQTPDDSVNKRSPVLGLQNTNKSSVRTTLQPRLVHCLKPLSAGHNNNASSPVVDFTNTEESWTLGYTVSASSSKNFISHGRNQQPPCSSSTKFKFTSKCAPVICSSGDSGRVVDLESEDALFLSACTELDAPSTKVLLEPDREEHRNAHELQGSTPQARLREDGASDGIVTKKLCMAVQIGSSSLGTSSSVQRQEGQITQTNTPKTCETPSMSTGLSLRPSTEKGWQHSLPFTSRPIALETSILTAINTTGIASTGMAYQSPKPIQASSCQARAGLSSSSDSHQGLMSFPFSTKSPQTCLASGRISRFTAPQMTIQNCISLKMPNSTFQQPHTLKPRAEPPAVRPRTPCSVAGPGSLQTPVLTNHVVQLVTAANKTPQTESWDMQARTRRFPGPAGILPHQYGGKNLEEILISTPHTPTHGALAKFCSEEASSSLQPADESFGRGPWSTMKAELGLDESNPSCFLRTSSVAMVLRKAVLKQLPKNKVPQMAVMLKSLTRATMDASAVFRDPTGEIQGTVHHMLLEDRESDLKAGAVLLLQQVGVFSPSLRNHYLNVTPNNLVKVYLPASDDSSSNQVPQQRENGARQDSSTSVGTVTPEALRRHTQTQLHPYRGGMPSSRNTTFLTHKAKAASSEQVAGDWGIDDLDGLLVELPEDSFSCMEGPG